MILPQHVVFFIGRLIDMMVPDIPEEVEMKMKREHYMAKEALAENQVQKQDVQTLQLSNKSFLMFHFAMNDQHILLSALSEIVWFVLCF